MKQCPFIKSIREIIFPGICFDVSDFQVLRVRKFSLGSQASRAVLHIHLNFNQCFIEFEGIRMETPEVLGEL